MQAATTEAFKAHRSTQPGLFNAVMPVSVPVSVLVSVSVPVSVLVSVSLPVSVSVSVSAVVYVDQAQAKALVCAQTCVSYLCRYST